MSAADSNPSDRISDEKLPLEFTAYFHLPHRRGRGATDFNFGRWVQHHSCDSGFPADRAERYDLWQRILTRFADEHGGENTQEVDDTVRKRAREAITKTKKVKRKVGGGAAGMAVNKVVLKGVRAGRDINVNVGVAAATGIELAEREKLMPEVDIPPPPYVDGGGSESGRVGEKSGDRVQRKSNRYLTRKRPRSRSPSDSPAPPSPESNANKQSQPQLQIPTTTSISVSRSSKQKQKQIRLRINPNTNPNATTNVTAPGQRITIPNTITPTSLNPNSNHDSLFSFRESLFTEY
ncbi:hypothetical protein L211DRAFT_454245 [Terfezia boudieri ATCC MYA-4762]|uniref:Uncharacterized protein n=1 Tax=Terfezia boudieri ATCC MYA-4762 TaxID=1051890 RepID=A0A3N4LE45_9PEZI|nr:hypothetical protein L211DRAFT_454245 [Terfezia boudieri ATCC MYA-4762]